MRYKFYQEFMLVLKYFASNDDFSIQVYCFNNSYSLFYDKEAKVFRFKRRYKSIPDFCDVYKMIKQYVEERIINEQKEFFEINKEEVVPSISFSEEQFEQYCYLVDEFKVYLIDEPFVPSDLPNTGSYYKLNYGFKDSKVSRNFLCDLLNKLKLDANDKLNNWEIYLPLCSKNSLMNEIEEFEAEGYVNLVFVDNYVKVVFTQKCLNAFKKSFFFEFDPKRKSMFIGGNDV